jgi:hypothetical protein
LWDRGVLGPASARARVRACVSWGAPVTACVYQWGSVGALALVVCVRARGVCARSGRSSARTVTRSAPGYSRGTHGVPTHTYARRCAYCCDAISACRPAEIGQYSTLPLGAVPLQPPCGCRWATPGRASADATEYRRPLTPPRAGTARSAGESPPAPRQSARDNATRTTSTCDCGNLRQPATTCDNLHSLGAPL